jgi:hypothetical protein
MMDAMAGLLVVCGVGCDPEREVTLEVLAALASCEVRFALLPPRHRSWLARRVGTMKNSTDAAAVARAAKTRRVGLAVWGHATITSEFARAAWNAAEAAGVETAVMASISPAGHALAASARSLGWRSDEDDGWDALPAGEIPRGKRTRPLAVFDAEAGALRIALPEDSDA